MSGVKHITPQNAMKLVAEGKAFFVDVRTTNEVVALTIANSVYVPRPLATEKKLQTFVQDGKSMIFYCHTGSRSDKLVGGISELNGGDIWSLDGGIVAWKKEGLPTEIMSQVISVERQTQIIVGILVLTSVVLGLTVDNVFFGATGLFGAGLLFSGLSGSCMMGVLLGALPWNK